MNVNYAEPPFDKKTRDTVKIGTVFFNVEMLAGATAERPAQYKFSVVSGPMSVDFRITGADTLELAKFFHSVGDVSKGWPV